MIAFANAKINIGLQVLGRRDDGYHDLETVFYPLKLYDVLEVVEAGELRLIPSGLTIPGDSSENLCLKAYRLLAAECGLPPVHIYLHKSIPIGAGLGGGSADAAFLLRLLNDQFALGYGEADLTVLARQLGADCAFFIRNRPAYATGIGDRLTGIDLDLSFYHLVLIKPRIHVSTAEAYAMVKPQSLSRSLLSAIAAPVETWRQTIFNDFESGIFLKYPEIKAVKTLLYEHGALYAAMSGSGSAVYGLFAEPVTLPDLGSGYQVFHIGND